MCVGVGMSGNMVFVFAPAWASVRACSVRVCVPGCRRVCASVVPPFGAHWGWAAGAHTRRLCSRRVAAVTAASAFVFFVGFMRAFVRAR
jgi:hypothetical protein